jgi:arginine/serine-rich splicing factor 17
MSLNFIVFEVKLLFFLKVDFDKSKHLSEPSIRRRRIEREKLMAQEREREERERREQELQEQKKEEER